MNNRAAKEIRKGEEVTNNYGASVGRMGVSERKAVLKKIYLFDCQCASCIG